MRVSNLTTMGETRFGIRESIKMNLDAGFDAIDMSFHPNTCFVWGEDDPAPTLRELRKYAESRGAIFNQAHAPFPCVRLDGDSEEIAEYNRITPEKIKRSIEWAGVLGCEQIVIHPVAVPNVDADTQLNYNLEHFAQYVKAGKDAGVKICIENMWGRHRDNNTRIVENVCSNGQELARYVDAFNDPFVTALVDIGHTGLVGGCADEMIRTVGSRLSGIHLHDNDYFGDQHTLPFLGKIDFDKIIQALVDVNYQGDITFEVGLFFSRMPNELYSHALKMMYEVGKYFRDRVVEGIAQKCK